MKNTILILLLSSILSATPLLKRYQELDRSLPYLSESQIQSIYEEALNHPVVSQTLSPGNSYDPDKIIGFCFGRAMAVHLLAKKYNIDPSSVKKLFVVGDLRENGKTVWRFHVTTLVKSPTGWVALDPILYYPMPVKSWIKTITYLWDKEEKAYYYLTDSKSVIPYLNEFTSIDNETGTHLIELKFNPDLYPDKLKKLPEFGDRVYATLDNTLTDTSDYFFSTPTGQYSFSFEELIVQDTVFGFNNFFRDLFEQL